MEHLARDVVSRNGLLDGVFIWDPGFGVRVEMQILKATSETVIFYTMETPGGVF